MWKEQQQKTENLGEKAKVTQMNPYKACHSNHGKLSSLFW